MCSVLRVASRPGRRRAGETFCIADSRRVPPPPRFPAKRQGRERGVSHGEDHREEQEAGEGPEGGGVLRALHRTCAKRENPSLRRLAPSAPSRCFSGEATFSDAAERLLRQPSATAPPQRAPLARLWVANKAVSRSSRRRRLVAVNRRNDTWVSVDKMDLSTVNVRRFPSPPSHRPGAPASAGRSLSRRATRTLRAAPPPRTSLQPRNSHHLAPSPRPQVDDVEVDDGTGAPKKKRKVEEHVEEARAPLLPPPPASPPPLPVAPTLLQPHAPASSPPRSLADAPAPAALSPRATRTSTRTPSGNTKSSPRRASLAFLACPLSPSSTAPPPPPLRPRLNPPPTHPPAGAEHPQDRAREVRDGDVVLQPLPP